MCIYIISIILNFTWKIIVELRTLLVGPVDTKSGLLVMGVLKWRIVEVLAMLDALA